MKEKISIFHAITGEYATDSQRLGLCYAVDYYVKVIVNDEIINLGVNSVHIISEKYFLSV